MAFAVVLYNNTVFARNGKSVFEGIISVQYIHRREIRGSAFQIQADVFFALPQ